MKISAYASQLLVKILHNFVIVFISRMNSFLVKMQRYRES